MKHLLRLIRFPNLLMIALTMGLVRYGIIQPIFLWYHIDLELPLLLFILLTASVMLVAAAGYMVNDYFDVKTDLVNHSDAVVVDKHIKASTVYRSYFVVNAVALGIALYVSIKVGLPALFVIFPVTMGLLWFYSTTYKREFLVGNIIVALITASVPIVVALYEMPLIHTKYQAFPVAYKILLKIIFGWCGAFALFAFIINLIREFVKDLEDYEGDMSIGRNTLPIVLGAKTTKVIIAIVVCIAIVLVEIIFFNYLSLAEQTMLDIASFLYFHFLVIIPLAVAAILNFMAREKKHYTYISLLLKFVMLLGILYALVVRFEILH